MAQVAHTALIGRDAEVGRVAAFLDAIEAGPAALLLEGELGIGKTALWGLGVATASERGLRVLRCRPVQCEEQLSYAALGDLLADVPGAAFAELPPPQRRALEVALLRAEPEGQESLQRAVSLGLLGLLRMLAAEQPTLLAIDDVHWLDTPSANALGFGVRRLAGERIGVLCARRDVTGEVPLGLDRALPAERLGRITLRGLSTSELDVLLRSELGAPLARSSIARIRRASGGNLYFALEIGRALVERGERLEPSAELPIPASLQEIVRERLAALPASARQAAQVAAALARPTVAVVDAALSAATGGSCAAAAVEAGILEQSGARLAFAHPLLATVAYQLLSESERRDLHARLAVLLDDPEERARHLASAASGPDANVAAALVGAARRAAARGAPDAAAELLEQARALTPEGDGEERRRRGIEAAERYFEAGDVGDARTLLEHVIAESRPGALRAHALARLGWVCTHQEGIRSGADVFFAALAEPTDDTRLRIEILQGLAWCLHSSRSVPAAAEHAGAALALAEELGDPTVLARTLALVAFLESVRGEGLAMGTIERALALEQSHA